MKDKDIEKEKAKKIAKKEPMETNVKKTNSKKNKIEKVKTRIPKNVEIEQLENKMNKATESKKSLAMEDTKIEKAKVQLELFEYVLLLIIISLIFSLIGYFVGIKGNKNNNNEYVAVDKELSQFIQAYNRILESYYGDKDSKELIQSAIDGMLSSIDDYSGSIDPNSTDSITLKGEYEGIGISVVNTFDNNIYIIGVYENSPAAKAGVKVGDIIYKINGEDYTGKDKSEAVDKMSELDEINLVVKRDEQELSFDLKKENIVIVTAFGEMLEDNIGYIRVELFAENTDEQFKTILKELENQNIGSLIIDLRDNSGGYLETATNMLSLFMNDTHIIYQTEDKEGIEKYYSNGDKDKEYKIVILQNENSASASEVMASALKEQLNAYIIGTNSFGKGTVQSLINIEGIGKYKLTTMKWLTSNGNWIQGEGLTPDLEVKLQMDFENPIDNQLQAALDYLKEEN